MHRMHGSDANGQIHGGYVRHVHRAGHGAGLVVRYGGVKHNAHPHTTGRVGPDHAEIWISPPLKEVPRAWRLTSR